jgi:hypothetical protein
MSVNADERRIRVALALQLGKPCLLCGAPPFGVGLFIPYSGSRIAAYSLCRACFARPDRAERAEVALEGRGV